MVRAGSESESQPRLHQRAAMAADPYGIGDTQKNQALGRQV